MFSATEPVILRLRGALSPRARLSGKKGHLPQGGAAEGGARGAPGRGRHTRPTRPGGRARPSHGGPWRLPHARFSVPEKAGWPAPRPRLRDAPGRWAPPPERRASWAFPENWATPPRRTCARPAAAPSGNRQGTEDSFISSKNGFARDTFPVRELGAWLTASGLGARDVSEDRGNNGDRGCALRGGPR